MNERFPVFEIGLLPLSIALLAAIACGSSDRKSAQLPSGPNSGDTGYVFQAGDGSNDTGENTKADFGFVTPETIGDAFSDANDTWEFLLPECGDEKVQVAQNITPASVLIIMDRSGSMEGEKWTQAQEAIGKVLDSYGGFINFGLLMYPQQKSKCLLTPAADVVFGLNQSQLIVKTMKDKGTGGDTPTAGAITAANQIFKSYPTAGEQLAIIATDGRPNCLMDCSTCPNAGCLFGSCDMCLNEDPCVEKEVMKAMQDFKISGVTTYVIGIAGSSGAKSILNQLAILGGTAKPGDPKYYEANDGVQLAQTMALIVGTVGSCSVKLDPVPGYVFLIVEIDGETIDKDPNHQNGWDFLEGDLLQFYGTACDAAAATGADVQVTYACKYTDQ